ncbi:hypothetical protein E2C01_014710 [Portunus trituberculatus]|uniref:Uncharacterized protein n=1 Tax=Portunus trituberculatus TaxID=210409 RepID=A0A5B7DL84_PORTR|nr:hypothetical protein [Portunus trituberculatus]
MYQSILLLLFLLSLRSFPPRYHCLTPSYDLKILVRLKRIYGGQKINGQNLHSFHPNISI